jgi:solute:Na+ symporter, SSS family
MNSWIDTSVIFIFSAFVLGIGLLFARTGTNLKSFFAGGEAVPWFIAGLSLFMSFFSASTFVAWGSIAYKNGWVAVTIQWTMCVGAIITGLFFAPRWKATGSLTAAEYIRERLGERVQKTYIYIFLVFSLFLKGSILYPVAKLVSSSLGFPLMPSTIVLGIMMIAYTAVGGLWAVMVTDILQFVILTASVVILLPLSLQKAGGFDGFVNNVPSDFFSLFSGEYMPGFILAFLIYNACQIGGNWTFVQRYTSVESPVAARKVAFLFAGLYIISPVLWMMPPMIYQSINPGLTGLDTENAYLMICKLVLPPGLLGLMLTGMYFSTSASANTTLNVVSAVLTNDVYKGFINPSATNKKLMFVARLSSWVVGVCMIGIALMVPFVGGLVSLVLSVSAIIGAPLLMPALWSLFSKRFSGAQAFWITIAGLTMNIFFKLISPWALSLQLSRTGEMAIGVGFTLLLLIICEWLLSPKAEISMEYSRYQAVRQKKKDETISITEEERLTIHKQNKFGLKVIAFSLVFTALMLLGLSLIASSGGTVTAAIALVILAGAVIPWRAAVKVYVPNLKTEVA